MAAIAEQIIKDNGFERKIRVVRKRSTEMSIEEDMGGKRANILGKRALARVILSRTCEMGEEKEPFQRQNMKLSPN